MNPEEANGQKFDYTISADDSEQATEPVSEQVAEQEPKEDKPLAQFDEDDRERDDDPSFIAQNEGFRYLKGEKKQRAREAILAALRAGNTVRDSYTYAGVSDRQWWNWITRDPEFAAKARQAEAGAKVFLVSRIAGAAKAGSWQAAVAILERRWPREWGKVEGVSRKIKEMNRDEIIQFVADQITDGGGGKPPKPNGSGTVGARYQVLPSGETERDDSE